MTVIADVTSPETVVEKTDTPDEAAVGALAGRIFEAGIGSMELLAIHLGQQLGLYRVLSEAGLTTASELARAADIHPRYAQEWLEQQAVAGFIQVDDAGAPPERRRFSITASHAAVLADESSLAYLAPFGGYLVGLGQVWPELLRAYRTGGGVPFGHFGDELREAQAALNRPAFDSLLAGWIADHLPDINERLLAGGDVRIADLGCGYGWSTIALAKAFPAATVFGLDNDGPSIEAARRAASASGQTSVHFHTGDAAELDLSGQFDLVCIFEALHDLPRPIDALAAVRSLIKPDGAVFILDERVADSFGPNGDLVERFMYSASVVHCLAVGMVDQPSAATGTVMRASTVERYASEAGFSRTTVLPLEVNCWRFYRLDP